MGEFQIDNSKIESLIVAVLMAKTTINTVNPVKSPSQCQGIMLSSYYDRMDRICKLIAKYKQLLEKDAGDIVNAKNKVASMDQQIAKNFIKNVGGRFGGGGFRGGGGSSGGGGASRHF